MELNRLYLYQTKQIRTFAQQNTRQPISFLAHELILEATKSSMQGTINVLHSWGQKVAIEPLLVLI